MSAPGLIMLPSGSAAAMLTLGLRRIFGADLIGLWIGEDIIVDGSNNVTSWPGRFGGALANGTASYYTKGALNGRSAVVGGAATVFMTATLAANVAAIMTVATSPGRGTSHSVVADSPASDGSIQENTNNAFPSPVYTAGGWSHYIDGVANENLTAGVHIIEGNSATTLSTQFRIGSAAGAFACKAPVGFYLALSAVPSAANRAAVTSILRAYYGF